jgi:hypothetical protein
LGVAAAALSLLALTACAPQPPGPATDTAAVVERFIAARQARNLDAAMACFGDQPELRSSVGIGWSGRDAVRGIIAYRLSDTYTVGTVNVVGKRATWSENVRRTVAGSPPAIFDEAIEVTIEGGRIARLVTYVGDARLLSTLLAESGATGTSPTSTRDLVVPLAVLVLVASSVLVWPERVAQPAQHAPHARLLAGLREYVARRG